MSHVAYMRNTLTEGNFTNRNVFLWIYSCEKNSGEMFAFLAVSQLVELVAGHEQLLMK